MITSILALAMMGTAKSPVQDAQLDLAVQGATLRAVGAEIGEKMGWDVVMDPSVESEVLVLRTKGQSASAVIAKISEVTGTRWIANGDQMLVQPDFDARNRELAKARMENSTKIIEAKKKFLEGMGPQTYKDEDGEEFTFEPDNDRILIGEMIAGLTDQFLTSIGPGQRVVLSSNPTPMQRALGRFNAQRITDWIKSENEGRQISEEDRLNMINDPEYQQYIQMFGGSMDQMMPKPITEAPQKVLLIVERSGRTEYDTPRLQITLKVQGQTGNTLLSTNAMLTAGGGSEFYYPGMSEAVEIAVESGIPIPGQETEQPEPRKPMPGDDLAMTVSEDVKAIHEATNVDFENPLGMKMSPKARDMMMRVDLYEPMRYEVGEFLFEAAEKMDKTLVVHLPDRLIQYGNDLPTKFGEVRDRFDAYGIEEKTDGDFWMVTPKKPGMAWTTRMDRKALAGTLSEAQNRMFLSLDTLATFKYRFPDADRNSISAHRLGVFAPQMEGALMGGSSNSMIRLYGAMSVGERQALRSNGSLTLGRLSSAARGVLQEMFFGFGGSVESVDIDKDLAPADPAGMMGDMMGMGGAFLGGGVQGTEPTEVMPNGLPANGIIAMKTHQETYLMAVTKEGGVSPGLPPIGRMELAMVSLMMKNPQFLAEMDQYAEVLRNLRAGSRDNLHLVVMTAPKMGKKGVLTDARDPDMTKVYGLTNLPEALRAQMDADREALEKSPMGKFFEMMGGGGFGGPGGPIKP